ncbi:MAG: hypothetical protein ACREL2_10695 [Gemmatimonadales bacterium]
MVIPIGDRDTQTLTVLTRGVDGILTTTTTDVRFVPLLGQHGFPE